MLTFLDKCYILARLMEPAGWGAAYVPLPACRVR